MRRSMRVMDRFNDEDEGGGGGRKKSWDVVLNVCCVGLCKVGFEFEVKDEVESTSSS